MQLIVAALMGDQAIRWVPRNRSLFRSYSYANFPGLGGGLNGSAQQLLGVYRRAF